MSSHSALGRHRIQRVAIMALVALLFSLLPSNTPPANAAPADQRGCAANAFLQFDMAGTFTSPYMNLEIYPCGGSYLSWSNQAGFHYATYYSSERIPGGGVGARGMTPDPNTGMYLDASYVIGFKPAEPGFIQVITLSPNGAIRGVYRLQKIG